MAGLGQAYERLEAPEVVLDGIAQLDVSITHFTKVVMLSICRSNLSIVGRC